MIAAAKSDPKIAARVKLFLYRVKEEFYDYEHDPAALHNLIDDPKFRKRIDGFRTRMRQRMKDLNDPLLTQFEAELILPRRN